MYKFSNSLPWSLQIRSIFKFFSFCSLVHKASMCSGASDLDLRRMTQVYLVKSSTTTMMYLFPPRDLVLVGAMKSRCSNVQKLQDPKQEEKWEHHSIVATFLLELFKCAIMIGWISLSGSTLSIISICILFSNLWTLLMRSYPYVVIARNFHFSVIFYILRGFRNLVICLLFDD